MATWTRSRLAALAQRTASRTVHVPTEVGGPLVTEMDIENAGQGIEKILTAFRSGTATEMQLRAIWAINDANSEAAEQRDREAIGYRAAAEDAPDPDVGPET